MENYIKNIPYFNFLISPLCDEKANEILEKVDNDFIHYLKVNGKKWASVIIKKDTHLFTYKSPVSLIENIENADTEDISNIHSLEDLNTLRNQDDNYFAKCNGILTCYDNKIKFVPISYNSICEVEINDDDKIATANFYPASGDGKQLLVSDVITEIRSKGITVALEKMEIVKALEFLKNKNEAIKKIVVAKGKNPKVGKEAWTEYLFDSNRKIGPAITEDGKIDFYNLNLIESVTENQKVGIYHPVVEGKNGYDLFNNVIFPPKLKDIGPPKGKNIYYREEEPTHMLSKIDGHIILVGSNIVITNKYNVRGDVDFHTGNIVSKGSLNVTKNVKSRFNIDMSGNITIGGYVKNSDIKSGGDVTIRGGFSGVGKGKITSGGDVKVRYIRNQVVYSRGDISVDKEVVEAKLFAKGDIKSSSNRMLLIGGRAVAGGNIVVKTLGHEYGIETKVEVGYDYDTKRQFKKINKKRKILKKDLVKLKEQIATALAGGNVGKLAKALLIKQQIIKKEYEELQKNRKELQASLSTASGSKIIVSGTIYPGVKIFIDGYKLKIKEKMKAKIFSASTEEDGIVIADK